MQPVVPCLLDEYRKEGKKEGSKGGRDYTAELERSGKGRNQQLLHACDVSGAHTTALGYDPLSGASRSLSGDRHALHVAVGTGYGCSGSGCGALPVSYGLQEWF